MWYLLLLIPAAAGAAYYKKKQDDAATTATTRPPPPPPLDAATVAAAQQGVPAAVQAVQEQLNAQLAAGQADPSSIEYPANTPAQDAANQAAQVTADTQAQGFQTQQQADQALQAALGGGGSSAGPIGTPVSRLPPGASPLRPTSSTAKSAVTMQARIAAVPQAPRPVLHAPVHAYIKQGS